jgi:DNA-binding response OmpR family regulator
MRALHAAGRSTEAVAAFGAYRERLREALGMAGALIETVRGAGYRLSAQALA